jgi:RNA polymerase sigma-70 factor (ECF subfamily)
MLDAQTTNHELVTAAQNPANNEAWLELHRAYHDPLIRHCDRSGLNPVEAEDVAALTLATLAMRLSRSSLKWEKSSLRGWLSETANRLIFDVHLNRKQQRLSADAARLMQEWLPPAFAPEDEHEAREKMESHLWSVCLARVKADVSPEQWQIFEAYALGGRKSSEVAALFNTTGLNVRVIRSRMVSRIREEWKQVANQEVEIPE